MPSATEPDRASSSSPSTARLVEARGLVKSYGTGEARFDALRGVDIAIDGGESVAIVGKSGSGKSTLMHILALLDTPTSGSVVVSGQDARGLGTRALNTLRNKTFGFVFQQFFMVPSATVLENVTLPLKIAGMNAKDRKERGMEVLHQVELADKAGNRGTNLSGGQKQRMVIARALANRPRAILADEPTGNLDSATGAVIEDLLFDLNRTQGITLIIVTHDEDLAARCGRRVYLKDGMVVDSLATAGVSA